MLKLGPWISSKTMFSNRGIIRYSQQKEGGSAHVKKWAELGILKRLCPAVRYQIYLQRQVTSDLFDGEEQTAKFNRCSTHENAKLLPTNRILILKEIQFLIY